MTTRSHVYIDGLYDLLLWLMGLVPLFYMVIRGWTNTGLIIVAVVSVIECCRQVQAVKLILKSPKVKWILLALAMPMIAVLIGQLLRGELSIRMLDGPSRSILAAAIFILCLLRRIKLLEYFQYSLSFSMLILVLVIHINPEPWSLWSGRFATYFVDPLTLGDFSLIIGFMCLIMIDNKSIFSWLIWSDVLKVSACISGIYLSLGSLSRSGWVTVPVLLLLVGMRFNLRAKTMLMTYIMATLVFIVICYFNAEVLARALSILSEPLAWFDAQQDNDITSAGIRLGLWVLGGYLIGRQPFSGYGDRGYEVLLKNDPDIIRIAPEVVRETLLKGPHNEYISSMLHSGVVGLIADVMLLCIPVIIVFGSRWYNATQSKIAYMIAVLCSGLAICGMTLEVFYLKYAISFYSFMVATLLAQFLLESQEHEQSAVRGRNADAGIQ